MQQTSKSNARGVLVFLAMVSSAWVAFPVTVRAQERPYFVTYSHALEEPGNLELALKTVGASPQGSGAFGSETFELEYGVNGWWTSELYLSGQKTSDDAPVFTGFRLENRVRPLMREHWINPVLYVEFEDINGADKSLLEVVGHDGVTDLAGSSDETRMEKKREIELKPILSGYHRGWNFAVNPIFEKNLDNSPWEFGYAIGTSRPLKLFATPNACSFCAERLTAGVEMYGGLGDRYSPGLHDTSHYLSPTLQWETRKATVILGPVFGLNENSARVLFRMKIAYEFSQVFRRDRR